MFLCFFYQDDFFTLLFFFYQLESVKEQLSMNLSTLGNLQKTSSEREVEFRRLQSKLEQDL